MRVQPNKAIVGANAFSHASGIHQDGMLKNRATYEIMKPEDVGSPGTTLPLTNRSGRNALVSKLKSMGLPVPEHRVMEFFERFKRYADGRKEVGERDIRRLWKAWEGQV
jgi:2-isopropylmalate synthase